MSLLKAVKTGVSGLEWYREKEAIPWMEADSAVEGEITDDGWRREARKTKRERRTGSLRSLAH